MSKAAMYVVNNSAQEVAINGTINPGSIIRRFGQCIGLSGNGIQFNSGGYYDVDTNITLSATEEGEVTVTLFKNGIAIPGANATQTAAAAGDIINLSLDAIIRQFECGYNPGPASLTFVITGIPVTVTNFASTIIKL